MSPIRTIGIFMNCGRGENTFRFSIPAQRWSPWRKGCSYLRQKSAKAILKGPHEGVHKPVDVFERVIKRRWRDPQDIRLPPVADHAHGRQPFPYVAYRARHADGKLRPAALRVSRREDGEAAI